MRGRRGAKNNPRDYGIARNFGSGLKGLKNPIGDPLPSLRSRRLGSDGRKKERGARERHARGVGAPRRVSPSHSFLHPFFPSAFFKG